MADTVKIPGVGPVKKQYAIAGAGVVVVIVGVAYYRHRNAPAAAEAPPADGSYTDATAGSTLPSGYQGDSGYYPSGGTPFAPYGYDIYGNPLPAPTGAHGTGGVYSNNNEWTTAAETALAEAGITTTVSAAAISKVLAGITVTPEQRDIFLQAVGLLGQPPQGYPQPIKLGSTPSAGPATPAPPTPGKKLPAPGGLKVVHVWKDSVQLDWNQVKGAIGYAVYLVPDGVGGSTPTGIRQRGSVLYDGFTAKGLKPGTRYRFDVHAIGHDNDIGARARIYATTKKK